MKFPLICTPGNTLVAAPFMFTARAMDGEKLLLLTLRFAAVAPAPTPRETEVSAEGAVEASTVDAPGPAKNPKVVFCVPVVLVAVLIFLPGELPMRFRFWMVLLSALVTMVAAKAIRMTDVKVTVSAAVF